ncbi:4Fe-4S dicluster domain-containing protein [Acidaminobacter sp. JC074]|uniref:EFR1 family ferrodoxin n=1 Tax=Acidaminobacter sp. JC074 TaxID=2530199 RepID=UPI001F0F2141|nr:EFR1 family ferrodoxin [Acidaminobacter sp. JC074]MCH4886418.1 4Fe-4S dicluster domain-containing protein [Acidaminobacter sp. JC074]
MKNLIYYFTGTGNSYAVAKSIATELGDTELIRITKNMDKVDKVAFTRLGIVYPVYFGAVPRPVVDFVLNKLKVDNAYVFSIATCGGMAAGANSHMKMILNRKGIKLNGAFEVSMPSNNQTSYPPYYKSQVLSSLKQVEQSLVSLTNHINDRVDNYSGSFMMGYAGKLLNPLMVRKDCAKNFYSESSCDGCGLCMRVCPAGNIVIEGRKPIWHEDCYKCNACIQLCPKEAIQYGQKTKLWGRYKHPDIKISDLMIKDTAF